MRVTTVGLVALPVVVGGIGISAAVAVLGASDPTPSALDGGAGDHPTREASVRLPGAAGGAAPSPSTDGTAIDGRRPYLTVIDGRSTLIPPAAIPGVLSLLPPPSTELPPLAELTPGIRGRDGLPLVVTPLPPVGGAHGTTRDPGETDTGPGSGESSRPARPGKPGTGTAPSPDPVEGGDSGRPNEPGGGGPSPLDATPEAPPQVDAPAEPKPPIIVRPPLTLPWPGTGPIKPPTKPDPSLTDDLPPADGEGIPEETPPSDGEVEPGESLPGDGEADAPGGPGDGADAGGPSGTQDGAPDGADPQGRDPRAGADDTLPPPG